MKKILRLVTTSVLTLTLVACGGQSSASSQSSTQSSSSTGTTTSSSSSAYAAVSSVSISAASSLLEQVSTSIKKVTVSATLNANTNPNTAIEWYIDGAKSIQSGKIFEFTPSGVGSFQVVAKVGSVSSNTIEVKVSAPEAVITIESVKVIDADTIEVKGSEGATIEIVGKTLKDQSYYDFIAKKYVLDVKEAIAQGDKLTVKLSKDGASKVFEYTYDTRALEVESLGDDAIENADGSYTIVKPFGTIESDKYYSVTLTADDIVGKNIAVKTSLSVPAGATKVEDTTFLKDLVGDKDAISTATYAVTKDSVVGDYKVVLTVGVKSIEVLIHVVDPVKSIEIKDDYFEYDNPTTADVEAYPVRYVFDRTDKDGTAEGYVLATQIAAADLTGKKVATGSTEDWMGVAANADGSYTIVKPYATVANSYFDFQIDAKHFVKNPLGAGNVYSVSLKGPSNMLSGENNELYSGIETDLIGTANTHKADLAQYAAMAGDSGTSALIHIGQEISANTPVGKYVFTVKAGEMGSEISKDIVIIIVAPEASLKGSIASFEEAAAGNYTERIADMKYDAVSNTYTVEKPIANSSLKYQYQVNFKLSNYQNRLATTDDTTADALAMNTYNFQNNTYNIGGTNALDQTYAGKYVFYELGGALAQNTFYKFGTKWYNGPAADVGAVAEYADTAVAADAYVMHAGALYKNTKGADSAATWDPAEWTVKTAAEYLADKAGAELTEASTPKASVLGAWVTAYEAEGIDLSKRAGASTAQYVFSKVSIATTSPDKGSASKNHKYAIQLAANETAVASLYTPGVLEINDKTVTGSYTYSVTIDGVSSKVTINVVDPQAQIFVLSQQNTPAGLTNALKGNVEYDDDSAVATARVSTSYENIFTSDGTAIAPASEGVYNIDKSLIGNGFSADIAVADLAKGTYAYSVVKEYPDASKNVSVSGTVKVGGATTATGIQFFQVGSAKDPDFLEEQIGAVEFHEAFLCEGVYSGDDDDGTYRFTYTIGSLTKSLVVNVGDFNPKLVIDKLTVGGTEVETIAAKSYLYIEKNVATKADVVVSLKASNLPAGTYYVSETAVDGALLSTLTKVVFDEDGIFTHKFATQIAQDVIVGSGVTPEKALEYELKLFAVNPLDASKGKLIDNGGIDFRVNQLDLTDEGNIVNPD